MQRIKLNSTEISAIDLLLADIIKNYAGADAEPFVKDAAVWSHQLPLRLRKGINELRLTEEDDGVFIVSGLPVDDDRIGSTPASLDALPAASPTYREEAFLVLVAVLLGDLIAWATQQSGRVIHDVFPIRDHEHMQLGTGCRELLTLHTEDAFHPFRADYLAMLCLRNPQRAPTTVASVASLNLDDATSQLLRQPHYTILPDESHRGITGIADDTQDAENRVEKMLRTPKKIPVLFGDQQRPYLRMDPYFMDLPEAQAPRHALQTLIGHLENSTVDVILEPGDVCIMDNYRVVHGRRPFQARFDGTDRWLKRVLVARDLRKSIVARSNIQSRVIT